MYARPDLDALKTQIHPTALVDPSARIGQGCHIGPYAVIEADVSLGDNCRVAAFAVIKQYTRLGRHVEIHEHAVVGGLPQDLGFEHCVSWLDVGEGTVIREHVTLHRASLPGSSTRIGARCLLMAGCHVAHDCELGDNVILANNVLLAGHVQVGAGAFLSGQVAVHQYCRIGRLAMVSGLSGVNLDILPFCTAQGERARPRGLNLVGMRRAGICTDSVQQLRSAYRIFAQSGMPLQAVLTELRQVSAPVCQEWASFVESSCRGVARVAASRHHHNE